MPATKKDILDQLQKDILLLQGYKAPSAGTVDMGLGPIAAAFPNAIFPTGAIHEFLCTCPENAAASTGFIASLIGPLMKSGGTCVWIGPEKKVFPPGLKSFGIEPDRVIFLDLKKENEALWAMEEALKCEGLAAVISEMREISFTASRRLQLAVEQSRVTGFILRRDPRNLNPNACIARWKITTLASEVINGMPGIGFPRWKIELERIRNGKPGLWTMEWSAGKCHLIIPEVPALPVEERRKTG